MRVRHEDIRKVAPIIFGLKSRTLEGVMRELFVEKLNIPPLMLEQIVNYLTLVGDYNGKRYPAPENWKGKSVTLAYVVAVYLMRETGKSLDELLNMSREERIGLWKKCL